MGNLVLQYFMAWLERTQPRTWRAWVDRHLWCYVGLGAPLLGAVGALKVLFQLVSRCFYYYLLHDPSQCSLLFHLVSSHF